MAVRNSRSRSTSRRPRRKLVWARHAGRVQLNPGGLLALAPLSTFEGIYAANLVGCTLMGVRGVITATVKGPTGVGGAQGIAGCRVGMRITDHGDLAPQDYAIGAMYGNQAHADWFLFEPFCLDNAGTIAAATDEVDTTAASEIRQIRNKSMRRFQELEQTVEMILGTPDPAGGLPNQCPISVSWDLSLLIALP